MNLTDLLENLSAKKVELWVDGDNLRYRGSEKVLSPELLAQIKQYKPEIIRILSQGSDHAATYPLSHGQKALWFLYQLAPESLAYNITYAAKLVKNLEIPALKQACQALVDRHPVLRTTFTTIDGEPVQTVHKHQQVDFSVENAFALDLDEVNNWLLQTSSRPFDLEHGPILRFNLLINHTKTKEHILLITQHHIVADFWSIEILLAELRVLYEAITLDIKPLLPEQKCQYRDYVKWSEQMLTGELGEKLWNYWQQQLCGELPVLSMPTDRPRLESQTYNGASLYFSVSEKLQQLLTELAKRERASLYMVLLTALQILLLRYTSQKDILIGSPMMNRSRPEFEKILGYFTNPVVLRADLSGNATFQELLGRSRLCVLNALEHQEYPFPLLVERLQPVRDSSISPLYQVALAWDRSHQDEQEASLMDSDGLFVELMSAGTKGAAFDLTLTILHASDSLNGTWNYNTDLFDSNTIERMASHFVTLLEAIVANPQQRIDQLPLLTQSEQHQLLVEWNDTTVDYPFDQCIHQLFEEQVARTPDAVAVVFDNQQLTYGELNAKANQLAHYLQSVGVRADVLVGICVERSLDIVVGLLGILKAGGAYVPLDPEYPIERLSFILEDAQVRVLLTQQHLVNFREHTAQLVCLDTDWQLISQSSQDNLIIDVQATHLAYVIYTSGSTGQPKGVEVIHRGVNRLLFGVNYVELNATQRFLHLAPISFDASTFEIWGALLHGGLCVILRERIPTAKNLGDEIDKHDITVLWLTAALFNSIIDENSQALSGIRQLLIGGEALSVAHVQKALSRLPLTQIINGYGPTESTTFTCCYPIPRQLEKNIESIPIGGPIANTQVYILDEYLQPVPIGVPGELHIGGAGLARGYLNRPDLTVEKFIDNPFDSSKSTTHSSKLYKTGDLARYLPNGNIEYLGRIDFQVKIRGFRIELGEIEAVLSQHGDVQASCVITGVDPTGDKRLVAYIVPQPDQTPTVSELLRFLKSKLPEYMVPRAIVILESLPLTPNGKVDRRALPTPEPIRELSDKFVAPRTPTEEMLALIWAQVLKIERVGIHDNFFALGGHSLLATQLVSRVRSSLVVELPLRNLFAAPTIAELSPLIQRLQQHSLELSAPPILSRDLNTELPLSFAQQRLWFLDQLEPLSASYNIPMALRLVGNLNVVALKQSLIEIIHRHSALRTNLITVDGKAAQIIHNATNWTVTVVDLQDLPLTKQEIAALKLTQLQAIEPFNLSCDALLRATLVLLSETEHVLNVCMHHVVSDGWSMGVFVEELAALYNAYSIGKPSPLVPLAIQYADFAIWQRQWLAGKVLQSQLSYWLKQLANAPTFLPLPTDRPRGAVQTFAGAYHELALSVELTQKLTKLSQEQGVTLFMTLLAGFKTLLYRYTGQTDILVGSPIANRHHSEIESLIGFFVNTLVLRTDLSGNPSFTELLLRTRSMTLDAYAHQDLPLEMLVEALQPERALSHTPLFQVMFALQNAPMSEVELSGLSVSSLPIETATTKFDLTLSMENTHTGLVSVWEYNTDLFDSSTIERMTSHFVTMLEAIVANPTERISALALMRASESQQLLVEWNDTFYEYTQDKCIHQLFEEQVDLTPDAVAVVDEDQKLTYQQLNCRANQLAHYLQSLGVSTNVLVGICVERSVEMVVGLLGILKAGGAYVPLDPEYPTERLSFMIEDAQVTLLLTQQHLVEKLQSNQAQLVCLDTKWQLISQLSQDHLITEVQATDLAYVIYTSGSTGTPKGVLIAHEGLLNLVAWHQQRFQITSSDKATQVAGTGFDAAVWELWPYLTAGASIHLVKTELLTSPVNLRDWLISQKITITFVPTPVAQELLSLEWTADVALRYMLTGGDQLHQYPSVSVPFPVVNNYGPTENTVVTTSGVVVAQEHEQISPSIGRPIANTQVYILDKYLQPVPIGVPGELHIGGAGLARGYLNRPDLTGEKFIPNPFNNSLLKIHSSKLYRTGDLGRYLPSGNIEYLGRIDFQVKIRGFRIELAEIEVVLSQREDVQSVVVIAREDIPGNKRLVAYIVPHPQVTPTVSKLRQFLKTKLPDYMVPSAMVILESLPLTPNGKIDKSALPVPESRAGIEAAIVLPRTEVEAKLALIWEQVLRVEGVGIHDNFFSLGGDSILSIQIIAKAKQAGIELTLKQLFANQTIAELATVAGTTKAVSIAQGLVSGTLPLTPIQQWFFEQKLPQPHHFNQSFLLTVPNDIKLEFLEQVWQELLLHHDALRLRFRLTEETWQQIHRHPTDRIAIPCFDLSTLASRLLHTAIETTANSLQASLNLSEKLVQVALFRLGNNQARLLIVIHHLVVDGVSWRILLEDLLCGYSQLIQGKAIQLPAKTTSFKDWASQLLEYAQSHRLKSELAYWLSASRASISPLPIDYAPGVNTFASTQTVSVSLTEGQTYSLLHDVPKAYKTQINDVLLTALVLVVSRWTNSQSMLFNLEGHGREDIIDDVDLSRTVGWFTTIFPVVLKLSAIDNDNIAQALKSVKEQLRAIPNKGIGYGLLHYLNVDAEISAQLQTIPTAQISFNYLGQFSQVLNTDSLMSLASESHGQSQSSQGERSSLLDINAIIANERLQVNWTYSSNIHQHKTIEKIAFEFVTTLQDIIAHCLEPEHAGYTPTDFPLIKLNQLELDGVLARLAFKPELQSHWQNLEDIYPLSPMQEGMLFESLYTPHSGVYFEQIICTFTGALDVQAFEQAWQQVVARHSIFRTAFVWESLSQPVQVVYRQVPVSVNTIDWRELSTVEQQAQLETFLDSERQQGLQLSQAPLIRLHLLQISENTYQFVWCHHHILLDGWSLPLVFQDLLEFYQAISQGTPFALPPTINYRNYIAWLQQQNQDLATEFWRQKLQGFSAPTPMTVDKPLSNRAPHSGYSTQEIHLTLPDTAAVVSFVREHQLTMNNLVQATWGLLLSRYSSETDVVFGATVSGRPPSIVGVESMVGLLINTLPVRVQISEKTELLSLLKDLQAQQVESEQFSFNSLVEIQGWSDVPRGTSLFESIVVFENYPVDTAVVEDNVSFTLSNFRGIERTNYPLTVVAIPGEQLLLKVSYDTGRFEQVTISRMLGHFVTMLSAIVANPLERISQLPMLTESESRQLLVEWNDTHVEYPQDLCIHHLFEEQVARTPDAVAVVFEDQQLTYGELNAKANQLAHYLRSLGVSADVLVGISVERSLSMPVGLLGILKAGGAYVPLDPEYPTERLSFMLEDAQVRVLLTQQQLVECLPQHQARVVHLDTDWRFICESSQESPITEVHSSNLAYVIYTSGSTGRPKGVMLSHSNLCNHMFWMQATFPLTEKDKVLQKTPFGFDASVWEFYAPLLVGGQLLIARPQGHTDSAYLLRLISQQQVTTVQLVPSLLQMLLEQGEIETCHSLKQVFCGGEVLAMTLLEGLLSKLNVNLYNLYGPTEACIDATSWNCHREMSGQLVPIGRPIANTQIYILDQYLQPVPIGVPGELHIGGAGLARGYLNRPELSKEKFIPNPFSTYPGSRLYKTGDLARYLSDGNIEYLGRIDNQVKIRGFRIELGEIEAVLNAHPQIQQAVVIAREDIPGNRRLVTYLVPSDESLTTNQLREFLKHKLPEYMVPSAIVILESLPLTPNGKVDKRALPSPDLSSELSDLYVAPRTPVEEILSLMWIQVLKVERVGIYDNFFTLGGHSLLATQLVSRIRNIFKCELPLRSLFAEATVAQLAQLIGQLQQQDLELSAPPILVRAENAELPLSYAQQRLWFLDQLEPNSALYNIPMALRLVGNLNVDALEQSLIEIIHRHSALRTNFIAVDGKASQIIHSSTNWTVSVVDLQHLPLTEKEITSKLLARQQALQPFNLSCDALIRATLVMLSKTEYVLNVCMHHVVSDGWSTGVFVEELAALYNAYSIAKPSQRDATLSPLVPLPIQYADFAIWQRQWLAGVVLQSQLNYWLKQLANAPTFLQLPTDRPRGAVQTFAGAYHEFALSVELTQKLTKLSQDQGVTLFMTLLASFKTLLYRYTGVADILVGSPIANRHHQEIESLIGFFVNTLVLRTDLSGNPSFNELLPRLRAMALDAYAHQDLPFEMLVEALQPERALSHTPLFQVMFALQNAPISEVQLTGLTVSSLPIETFNAKFDLSISMENTHTGLVGVWEYNTDLFERNTIERMASHFVTLLEAIVVNPHQSIDQLPLLTVSEQQQLLVEWNDTTVDYACDQCIHHLFEEQVARTPDAVAVVFENQKLTYGELNAKANQLAHYLRSIGIGADVLVGICVERSIEMVVGLLGILKAGGAYVPIDPNYPLERIQFMLSDAGTSVLLTQSFLTDQLLAANLEIPQVICLDLSTFAEQLTNNPSRKSTPDNLAYVIYTSGSTGRPKGVMIEHLALVNLSLSWAKIFQVQPQSRVLQFGSFSFDLSIAEIATTFVMGASLYLANKETLLPSQILVNFLATHKITHSFLSPSALSVLPQATLSDLQTISVGGEACSGELVTQWGLERRFFNCYGPTESTVTAAIALSQPNGKKPPIGKPLPNIRIYILDAHNQLLPPGIPGELCIAGIGLARGYLNRPETTTEKFVEVELFGKTERIYKTGDLARWLVDGNLEYLGRIDNQVKIRGFRIELGEIEAVLSQLEDVQSSVVIARVDTPGNKRLVAYIVPQLNQTPTFSSVRQFLKSKLPDYMIPSTMVILESLPLTPNGKIDHRALPVPESRAGIEVAIVLPRTGVEAKLAQIWSQVLRVPVVGIHDNFFSLGGDSILSIQIIAKAKLAGIELSVKQLFANQTIASLATVAGTTKALSIAQGLVSGTVPLTPIQQWFFEQNFPQPHHFNQSFLLTVPNDIKLELLEQILQQLLLHHDALRLRFRQTESDWQQIYSNPTDRIEIPCFDLSTLALSELHTAIETTANSLQASLNLSEKLVQVALFRLGIDKSARLLIVIHHLVVDGVSWRILLEDLLCGYSQLTQGKAIELHSKTTSFKDWAQQLTKYAQTEVLKSELAYWLSASNSSVSPLPIDYALGVNTVASTNTVSVSLNESETHSLLQDVPKAYKTQINDVLLTALVLVVSSWTNSKSVLFNLEGHGREDIIEGVDLSRTVGWFTTIFPVVLKLEAIDNDNIAQALKSVKEQLRAIPNKGIGYSLLRYLNEDPQITAQLQTIPTAQISFNYLGQFSQVLNTDSLMSLASESHGQSQSSQGERPYLLDINAIIANEQLQIDWTYSTNIYQHTTIENLAFEFVETLRSLIAHCLDPKNAGYTPTDFPLIKLNQLELDLVLARLALKPQLQSYWQNIEDIYPLSPMQEGMLFETLYAADKSVYFEQMICTFTGSLDVQAFEQAWQQVVSRHSIFRTAFVWESISQPVQVVYRQVQVTLENIDWRELSNVEQSAELETFLDHLRQQGLPLSQAPLMRLHLLQISENSYQFVWSFHHILLDGWSLPLVFQDLFAFYQAISDGTPLALQPTISYRNYIAWLQQQDQDLAREFWRQKLQSFSAPTPLTVDQPLLNQKEHSSSSEQLIHLTLSATAAAVSFVRQHQLTMNNLVQVTWALLLSRYSSETDVVFGATVSGRPPSLVGVESMVGLFINTMPVRVQILQETELLGLLKDLQSQQVESEQFSFFSLVEIQGLSDVPRGTSLFESIVVFENYPVDTAVVEDNGSFSISNSRAIEQTNYPLTVVAVPGEQLLLKVSYDTSRFEQVTISRMLGHFVTLLEAIIANPTERISALPMLTATEEQQLLFEWNSTTVEYPTDKCIHQLFKEQVERTPDAVAVVYENQQLTYEQLNCRANQLAHYLQSLGVGPEVLVGICVERSLEMVVGLLGILKAGGAYVPLDPEYPTERLSFMLEDAQVSVLLTQQRLVERLLEHGVQLVCLDTDWRLISQESEENSASGVTPENLAYVIYTSGSTGKPKGAMNTHVGLKNRLLWMQDAYQLTVADRVLQKTPFSFDVSLWEFFWPLLVGARLVVVQPGGHQDSNYLVNVIAQQQVTTLHFVPSMLQLFLQEQGLEACSCLRQVMCSGEALPFELQERFFAGLNAQLHNLYGPTEAAIDVTFWACRSQSNQRIVPIGRPIANTQIYILDQYLQPVPIGVPGELHIGGAGLARGYLNRPDLTVEKFIPNPFDNSKITCPESKLYKTGDKARYLPSGNIEYLGRIDFQVKIRGFRIELGEIEAVLRQHQDVQASCVIAKEDTPGDQRLVAYIVPQPQVTPTVSELLRFLKEKLPNYMVPSAIVILESLPLTPNGKIDRRALPIPELRTIEASLVTPRTPVEAKLAQIWAQVLKVELVGIDDNFFEIGGHSLLATQVMSRLQEAFGTQLPLRCLFESPTIAQLSEVILAELQTGSSLTVAAIVPVSSRQDIPLSWAQERLWFMHQIEGESGAYTMSFTVNLMGDLMIKDLEQAFQSMVQRHEVLRTRFEIKNNLPVQVVVPNITITLPVVDLQQVPDPWKQVKELATKEAVRPFDLVHGSVLRVMLWQVSPQEYVLLVAIHHIAADGWSMGIFIRDLSAYYRAIVTDSSVELPNLSVQYADFTIWQRQWLTDQILERQLNYWMQQLAGVPPRLALPTDRSRPAIQTFRGGTQQLQLDGLLTKQLKKLSQKSGTTLFMTLLAAFVVLMSRYSGQRDLVVGSPIANRNRTEIEQLIGFFVNTLALRFYLSPEQSFEALLAQVQQVTQNAYDHQDLPFEMLVEHLELERNLDRNPLVQVMFALQNAPTSPWELPGLRVEETALGLDSVRFDLEIHLWDLPEGVEGVCAYNKDLFDGSTIVRMMQHFQTLLAAIVANPQQPLALLPLLTQHEHHQILVEWNNTQADYPQNQCIHQLFEKQVLRTPDAVAVVYENQQLTYGELNCRANQLAHYLRSVGVSADVLVGICVKRSVDMIVGLLGILKAGGAYVPLDPEYPTERLALIIEDAQISVLLTTDKLADAIPKHQALVICYNKDSIDIVLQSEENPKGKVSSDCLAYVIYTSGSTGKPKGVSVTHRSVNRLVLNTNYIHIEPLDVIAQASNYAFDAATFEIWGGLLQGARLLGVSKELALSPSSFTALIREQRISILFLTTALFNQIAQAVPSAFNSLRYLLFGGEAVDPKWVQEVLKNGGPQRLLHVYGPTENTTFTSWYLVQDVPKDATTIPIGRPIANTQVYILDSDLQPVPVGVPGELHIGGAGLARGYLNARELTQQKFIPNPFDNSKMNCHSSKLYKTGDLARYLPDGNIEYLGRIDNQVKIRGFRIELGEIESVLNQHPLVQESVVVTRSFSSGDKSLVAYLVPGSKSQVLPQQFAQWQSEYFSDWQTLYEQTYGQTQASTDDLTFNIAGWNSSYTRQPIPEREMREWVESTVSRIMTLLPERVLEIGCGTGLLLSRIAKGCQKYCGTDYSIAAIKHVEQVCATVEGLEHVRLLHQMADNFAGIPQGEFDTVILNSIVQYFPSVEYLLQVLEGAMATIGTQGKIFVGDVRSLPLLEPYYAAVQLSQAAESIRIEQWQQQVHSSVAAEEELVIDPRFFIALKQSFPQITWVEIQPKRGQFQNELTQFRYDVTMHLGTTVQTRVVPWLNWQLDQLSFTQIHNKLLSEQPQLLGIRAVPNQRVQQALQICQWLEHPPSVETVGQLRELLAEQPAVGINPEQFWQLGQDLSYTVDLSWWGSSHDGSYDVVFCHNSSTPTSNPCSAIAFWDTEAVTAKPWTNYTNNPLHGKLVQKLVPQVREFIQQKLPNYMVPQAFVLLNALPLTPNGKVDRRSLPTPDTASRNLSTGFVSPRTPIEAQLTKIWSEVLGLEPIGVRDNFFEIGGHSLLATQVISRINSAFALDLSVQKMFEFPTVAGIASYMEVMDWATTDLLVDHINAEIVEF